MAESLAYYAFMVLIAYVIYWSVSRDPGPGAGAERRKFSLDGVRTTKTERQSPASNRHGGDAGT